MLGETLAVEMLAAVERLLDGLKLAINERKFRRLRCPEEPMEFLGYRFGWNYRPHGGQAYIGSRPSKASVQSICREISERTDRRWEHQVPERLVGELNRMISGWARYFQLGQVSPAYATVYAHAAKRLRRWLRRNREVQSGKYVRLPRDRWWHHHGLVRLAPMTTGLP